MQMRNISELLWATIQRISGAGGADTAPRAHHRRGYLTSFYLEIYPMYRDGAITAEQCARMTQERFEMYKAEQGK